MVQPGGARFEPPLVNLLPAGDLNAALEALRLRKNPARTAVPAPQRGQHQ